MEELISDITPNSRGTQLLGAPQTKSFIPVKKKKKKKKKKIERGFKENTQIIQSLSAASHNEMLSFHGIPLPQRRTLE